uniref:Integrase, catalytic region, zinc finger, CCHC-type, peptidase aspartic, catalytic n=1 Tax=Tanacetum cinerariifolium TaxID=118510 RepID=A0A699LCK4_TANCI|nr:hypothetical protein [Tanacetum cinerariifolium]
MMGNRALLTNFVEKFLGTVHFGNNDFAVIAGYGDVVIGSMTIKKVYYVEDGVDLLTGDRSSNLYTIALNEVALNSSTCLVAKASSSQSWLWHQRKIHQKHHKSKTAFASNKPLYLLQMDLYGPIRVESINGKRYVLVVVDDYSRYTWIFFLYSKYEASEVIISFIKKTQVNLQLKFSVFELIMAEAIATACFTQNRSIIHKRFEKTPYELMNKRKPNIKFFRVFGCRCYLLNDYEDVGKLKAKGDIGVIVKSSTKNVETSINEEVFHEVSESFQGESSSSLLNDDVQQSLEDAYFNASTSFHDRSNVHTFYQPCLHEKKWTKDHPLHKIIGDPKSSVRRRGQPANLCLFSCLLSSIEPANVAEAMRDDD